MRRPETSSCRSTARSRPRTPSALRCPPSTRRGWRPPYRTRRAGRHRYPPHATSSTGPVRPPVDSGATPRWPGSPSTSPTSAWTNAPPHQAATASTRCADYGRPAPARPSSTLARSPSWPGRWATTYEWSSASGRARQAIGSTRSPGPTYTRGSKYASPASAGYHSTRRHPVRPATRPSGPGLMIRPQPEPRRPTRPGGTPHDPAFSHTVLALAVCVGLMTLYIATVPLTKAARRRRRRRVADPRQRTVGAWRETLSRLGEAGLKVGRSDTSGEVIAAAQARFGDSLAQSLRPLALLYDEAAFAPQPLPATSADAAWRHADLARRAIRNVLRPTARLRTTLTLRVAR